MGCTEQSIATILNQLMVSASMTDARKSCAHARISCDIDKDGYCPHSSYEASLAMGRRWTRHSTRLCSCTSSSTACCKITTRDRPDETGCRKSSARGENSTQIDLQFDGEKLRRNVLVAYLPAEFSSVTRAWLMFVRFVPTIPLGGSVQSTTGLSERGLTPHLANL